MMLEDWSGEVVNESYRLTDAQIVRLLAMVEVLRDPINMQQVIEIKDNLNSGTESESFSKQCIEFAQSLWSEFTEEEQTALWVAPTYGGIFTTDERKALRP